MEIRDWIMISSAAIVIAGWYAASWRARKNEIAKERRTLRLEMLHSYYPIVHFINDINLKDGKISSGTDLEKLRELIGTARTKFLLYGYNDEIQAYEDLVAAFLSKDGTRKIECVNLVADIVRLRIRKELELPSHTLERMRHE